MYKKWWIRKNGHVCPSNMKVHIDNKQINVQYYSTHLWHTKDIGKLRLFNEDRSKIADNLYESLNKYKVIYVHNYITYHI